MRVSFAGWLLLAASAARVAHAEAAPPVAIDVAPCVAVEPDALEKLVAIELGTSIGADADAAERAALTHVAIDCVDAYTEIRLDDAITRKTLTRRVDLAPVDPSARTRLLALTIAELVVASWIELSLDPPALEPAGPPPPPAVREQARTTARIEADLAKDSDGSQVRSERERATWELGLVLGGRLWTGEPAPLVGGGLDLVHRPHDHVGWLAAFGVERGLDRLEVAEGRVALSGVDLLLAGLLHTRVGRAELAAGAGAFAVLAVVEGLPSPDLSLQGRDAQMVAAGPALVMRLTLVLSDRTGVVVRATGGPVTLPARATSAGRSVAELEGARLSADLGLAVAL